MQIFYANNDDVPSKVKRYLNESTDLSISTLQYYYNFPQRYRAKCTDLVRKTRQANVEELIRKNKGRWETEAETFRENWFRSIAESLSAKGLVIELGDKKKRIRTAPKDPAPSSFRFLDEIDLMESVEEKKRALKDIVKRFVPQWRHIVSKRFELVKFFAEKASLS